MIHRDRIQLLNDADCDPDGQFVLYWMQQSQRAECNHALEYAVALAGDRDQGVVVGFGLTDDYPDANKRHYAFMLEGLSEVRDTLHERGIKFVVRKGPPDDVALSLAKQASLIVCDRGYLRHQCQWRDTVAAKAGKRVVQVEGDVVVPVDAVSGKSEFAARTIRPKINRVREDYLDNPGAAQPARSTLPLHLTGDVDVSDPGAVLQQLDIDGSVPRVERFQGGTSRARTLLTGFLRSGLDGYADARNDPSSPQCSNLSPYLHFGQISPLEIVKKVKAAKSGSSEDVGSFLEELIVRRELAANFVRFADDYDSYQCLPDWARQTLRAHKDDDRPHIYTTAQLEACDTHDPYWNAAMREMVRTGYMHNYMRMYWGKKVLEWSNTPDHAYRTLLDLNNKYFLDGRDMNSYASVAWIFGLHDRPWKEREIFGKVRYMAASGLERKFDIGGYVEWTKSL
jgi:deoxyribodipyrimidine photo-lyase